MAGKRTSGDTTDVTAMGDTVRPDPARLDTEAAGSPTVPIEPGDPDAHRRGDTLGRYMIVEQIGRGGMGVVYAAYDPQLDRKVAVKLLHRRGRASGVARLMREAQAMAKLSHPNVLAVLDVGQREQQVFVAMEYVAGTTLTAWLVAPRTWREVTDVFVAAGRGLAAAHHAGVLHRDVKPDNILVGDDGRVRVADFGLARAAADATTTSSITSEDATDATGPTAPPPSALSHNLTQTGSMLGTPAYMAPEQYRGESSAAADQFSFCVALFEGLYGERPFAGQTAEELLGAIVDGRVRDVPSPVAAPPWLRRVVVRGLAADPAARWPSMDALLAALGRDPTRRRRRALAAAAALIAIGGGATALALHGGGRSACDGAADELREVWSAQRKQAVHAAFERTGVPYAPSTWLTVERALDNYARRWAVMRTEACVAEERDEPEGDLRAMCLDRRLAELRAQVALFAAADRALVGRAVVVAYRLPALDSCSDPHMLAAAGLDDARMRAAAMPLWQTLDRAEPALTAGHAAEAKALAEQVAADARRLGLPRVEGEADMIVAGAQRELGDPAASEQTYFAAALAAQAGGDDLRAIDAWSDLAFVIGYEEQRHAEGRRFAQLAAATLDRIGGDEHRKADLAGLRGTLEWADGDYAAARRDHTFALHERERMLGPDDPEVATSLFDLAIVEKADGHYDLAEALDRRAIGILVGQLGASHPRLVGAYSNLGNVYGAQGDWKSALEWHQRAVAVAEKAFGPESSDLAFYLTNEGASLSNLGRDDDALPVYARALAIQEKALGDHPDVAVTVTNIALIDLARGRVDAARAGFERSLAIDEKALGAEHPAVADDLDNLGDALHELHRDADALARHQRALAIREKTSQDGPQIPMSLIGVGNSLVAVGRAADAIAPLERAVTVREAAAGDPLEIADARFALARALAAAGRERDRAISLATRALDAFSAGGPAAASRRRDAEAWLAAHGAR